MPSIRPSTLVVLLGLCAASLPVRAQSTSALDTALQAWSAARGEGRDTAAALDGLRKALPPRTAWGAALGRALGRTRALPRPEGRPGKVIELESRAGLFAHEALTWAHRLPRDYDADSGPYPLVLSLPDEGEGPADHIRTHWSEAAVRDGAIVVSPRMPADMSEWTQVSVDGRAGGLCHVLSALRLAEERFAVDPERVWVVGRGKGVPAALAAADAFPQRFAAVIGQAGDALAPRTDGKPVNMLDNLLNVPVLLAGGGAGATALAEAARTAGLAAIERRGAAGELELWNWMLQHPRRSFPERVRVAPGDPFPTRAHWLRIAPTASDARVSAHIDRAANRITIDGQGFSRATLYLADELLDLDRPLKVVCNGVEREHLAERDPALALDLLEDGTSDTSCVYVAEWTVGAAADDAPDAEFTARLTAAGDDRELSWELARWCWDHDRVPAGVRVLEKLLRLDPGHTAAREALGHAFGYERWFPSSDALARFAAGQDDAVARARGYVKYKSLWVHPADRANFGKGLAKDPFTGQWLGLPETKRLSAGWTRQDLAWIAPEEAVHVDLGLWRVDGRWLSLGEAERRRAHIERMWTIPGPEILLHTTVERRIALWAAQHMQRALDDLRKVFGVEPPLPLEVTLLADEEQYDRFAFGAPDGRRPPTHVGRLHTVHTAYFAESRFETEDGAARFRGTGVGYWDTHVPDGDGYGVHSARLAAGLSYVEALDPSPKAVRKVARAGPGPEYLAAYLAEKRLPAWLRYGGAVYAERFFEDTTVGEDGDRWWARRWSLENLRARGGLRPLDEVLAFALDPAQREDALGLLIESGLLIAFTLDGGCAPVSAAHAELKLALAAGASPTPALETWIEALRANESALRAFADTP